MAEDPEQISMSTGTKVKAAKLFGNLDSRRASLNPSDEKKRVIRLVSHFALHYTQVKFQILT